MVRPHPLFEHKKRRQVRLDRTGSVAVAIAVQARRSLLGRTGEPGKHISSPAPQDPWWDSERKLYLGLFMVLAVGGYWFAYHLHKHGGFLEREERQQAAAGGQRPGESGGGTFGSARPAAPTLLAPARRADLAGVLEREGLRVGAVIGVQVRPVPFVLLAPFIPLPRLAAAVVVRCMLCVKLGRAGNKKPATGLAALNYVADGGLCAQPDSKIPHATGRQLCS